MTETTEQAVAKLIFRLECLEEETQEAEAQGCSIEAIKLFRVLTAENTRLREELDAMKAERDVVAETETVAETIWQAGAERTRGKRRSVPWSEVSGEDAEKYRFVARRVMAALADA